MRKQILGIVGAALICAATVIPTYAQDLSSTSSAAQASAEVAVTDGVAGYAQGQPVAASIPNSDSLSTTASATGIYPFEIKHETLGGQPVIIKSFKAAAGHDPQTLVEGEFEENGYCYSIRDILIGEAEIKQETKMVAQTVATTTTDDKEETVMRGYPALVEYDEGGFKGQLLLDYSSILSSVSGTEQYSYPIRKEVDVPSLNNNDYAYLDKDLDGLALEGAQWDPQGETQRADVMLPSGYNATAVYTGTGYGTKATGYENTAVYTGTVTKTYEGNSVYSIIYQGAPIKNVAGAVWGGIGIGLLVIAAVGCVVWLLITKFIPNYKSRRKSSGPNVPVAMP